MKKSENALTLHLTSIGGVSLSRIIFKSASSNSSYVGVRGSMVPPKAIPFRWGTTIHSLTLLFVKAALIKSEEEYFTPLLEGRGRCPAATICNLVSKNSESNCLDLFGADFCGRSNLHRILSICNARFTHSGPAQIYLRSTFLSSPSIMIILDGEDISADIGRLKSTAKQLENAWPIEIAERNSVKGLLLNFPKETISLSHKEDLSKV